LEDIDPWEVATEKTRRALLGLLSKDNDNYANALARKLHIKNKVCAFHLKTLEKAGLVQGKFILTTTDSDKKVAIKHFTLTDRGKKICKLLQTKI
jgi:predicted ArsR family transcriptional regulator